MRQIIIPPQATWRLLSVRIHSISLQMTIYNSKTNPYLVHKATKVIQSISFYNIQCNTLLHHIQYIYQIYSHHIISFSLDYYFGIDPFKYCIISEPRSLSETSPTSESLSREVTTSQMASACLFELNQVFNIIGLESFRK